MKRLLLATTIAVATVSAVGVAAPAAQGHPGAAATTRVVIRPVTSGGHVRPGFTQTKQSSVQVGCSVATPSPGAVSRNVEWCSPSAAYAIACWKAAARGHVLCMRDPAKRAVVELPRTGAFAATAEAPRSQRAPLLLVLADGATCAIRDGGAWSQLKSHPNWDGTYSCSKGSDVWSPPHASHWGIDEATSEWTVHTAASSGTGPVVVRRIAKAYFVGTYANRPR